MKTSGPGFRMGLVLALGVFGAGCGGEAAGEEEELGAEETAIRKGERITSVVVEDGPWTVYADPYANGTANPAEGIEGVASAVTTRSGKTYVALSARNLPPDRTFGAHVHKLPCADLTKAGGHYQNVISPTTPTDMAYANPTNEIWLDFTTGAGGRGHSCATANFLIRQDGAKAIVVHTNGTATGGVAGAKLACLDIDFSAGVRR